MIEKARFKSVQYFMNLGVKGNNLLMIIDIHDAIPKLLKDDSGLIQFLEVDVISYNTFFYRSVGSVSRASASQPGGRGFELLPRHTKRR